MKHGIYVGMKYLKLRGKAAVIKLRDCDTVYVQFDDTDLPDRLGYGWHRFPIGDFLLDDKKT